MYFQAIIFTEIFYNQINKLFGKVADNIGFIGIV